MKNKRLVKTIGLVVLLCAGCASNAVNWADLPPESAEPTPLEGTWAGVETNVTGPVQFEYQFKGNTYVMRTIDPNPGNVGGWWKGIWSFTDTKITLYPVQGYDSNGIRNFQTGTIQYKWGMYSDYVKASHGTVKKYTLVSDTLAFGKAQFRKLDRPVKLPEEYVFFQNDNNVLVNEQGPNPYAFTITAVDDRKARYVNAAFLGEGYAPIEIADPGIHKISFRQKYTYSENVSRSMESDVEGYFTRNFEPGIYSFSLYTSQYDAFMPKNLPPVPEGSTRIVIMKREIGESEDLYDYIDISTTNSYR